MKRAQAITRPDLGHQRFWYWRGWRLRYTYLKPSDPVAQARTPMLSRHGFGASLEQWRSNLSSWGQQRPVYALDLLGFGHSQKAAVLLGAVVVVAAADVFVVDGGTLFGLVTRGSVETVLGLTFEAESRLRSALP